MLGDQRLLGEERVGGQIDRRADPVLVAAAADQSIALNKGAKKEQSQRQAEKAAAAAAAATAAATTGYQETKAQEKNAPAEAAPAETAEATSFSAKLSPIAIDASSEDKIAHCQAALAALGLPSDVVYRHPAVHTVEEMMQHVGSLEGLPVKNLLLKVKGRLHPHRLLAHRAKTALDTGSEHP